jgi:uncharacterized OsmC-like protein
MSKNAALLRNGINVKGLQDFKKDIAINPENGMINYKVNLEWLGGTKSKVTTTGITLGNDKLNRNFSFIIDEPEQILGENTNPTPQEYLLGGMGGCILVGYSVGASVLGITLEKLEVDLEADLDLRGFTEVNPDSPIGFIDVKYTIRVKGDGTREQFESIHQKVIETSPNRATISNPINVICDLEIEE